MDECELIILVSTVACTLSKHYTSEELSVLSSVFNQLGDTLSTILAKRELCDSTNAKTITTKDDNNNDSLKIQ